LFASANCCMYRWKAIFSFKMRGSSPKDPFFS